MFIISDKDHMSIICHIFLCTSSLFFALCFIYGKGDTKHPNERKYRIHQHKKRLHPPIWIFFKVKVWSGGFDKQIMPWSSCDGGLHLVQINCRWNIYHVPCTLDVDRISFVLVMMDSVHGILVGEPSKNLNWVSFSRSFSSTNMYFNKYLDSTIKK